MHAKINNELNEKVCLVENFSNINHSVFVLIELADDEKQRIFNDKIILRNQLQEQVDEKQRLIKEEKLAETIANAELNKTTSITTIIGSRLATPYANLVKDVR